MVKQELPKEFLDRLSSVTGKRSRVVIDHILEHGYITTEELEEKYGYNHPPRAVRDVREQGIPLEMFRVINKQGRTIAAYRFGNLSELRDLNGREVLPKILKQTLIDQKGSYCSICMTRFESTVLQVDHRIPFEVGGEVINPEIHTEEYMLLCGSCNRAKSWSCEHCPNWKETRDQYVCESCYWADPECYEHIGLRRIRRLDIIWDEHEIKLYEELLQKAQVDHKSMSDYVKRVLKTYLESSQ
jgi:hypothetical protein